MKSSGKRRFMATSTTLSMPFFRDLLSHPIKRLLSGDREAERRYPPPEQDDSNPCPWRMATVPVTKLPKLFAQHIGRVLEIKRVEQQGIMRSVPFSIVAPADDEFPIELKVRHDHPALSSQSWHNPIKDRAICLQRMQEKQRLSAADVCNVERSFVQFNVSHMPHQPSDTEQLLDELFIDRNDSTLPV